jgi:hypothetical protein
MVMESEILNVVNLISDKKRADALDKIDDILYARASEVIDTYKKTVASTYFDEPVDTEEE